MNTGLVIKPAKQALKILHGSFTEEKIKKSVQSVLSVFFCICREGKFK
jgi:hypothetical protein